MAELYIFSIGIILGCTLSYVFFKSGIKSNMDTVRLTYDINTVSEPLEPEEEKNMPDIDTSMDWDNYPYTNEYNDKDGVIIGYIDPENEEKN